MRADDSVLVSADSHVVEPPDLWVRKLPSSMKDRAPRYEELGKGNLFQKHLGGADPVARVSEMAVDGVSGEVLYPSSAMDQYGLPDAELQEACFRVYNDWLIEYCSHASDRLWGIAAISLYRIDQAIAEMKRCKAAGLRGVMIWQVPPPELAFDSGHYERFWAAAEELEMPVSLHILTGFGYGPGVAKGALKRSATELTRFAVNTKLLHVSNAVADLIVSGVTERYPRLRFVLVENEVSWLPFILSQMDKYCARGIAKDVIKLSPSEYFQRQFCVTFFNDPPTRWLFANWGADNGMWSNDFPHPNSTWPKSREVIARDLGALDDITRGKLLGGNVMRLYGIRSVAPVDVQS